MVVKEKASAAVREPVRVPTTPDPRLKKIYVYAEGTFVLHNAAEVHVIPIKTPAFDVSGWIDLSSMRPGGDTVQTEIRVSFANRSNVLYQRTMFESPQLIALADMTNRLNYCPGVPSKSGCSRRRRTTTSPS